MSAPLLWLSLSLGFSVILLGVIAALALRLRKVRLSAAAALRRKDRAIARVFRIFNDFIVKEVQSGSDEPLDKVMSALGEREIRNVRRTSMMGTARLLIEKERPGVAATLLGKYIQPRRDDQLLYFLEPLLHLNNLGLLQGKLQNFCAAFQSSHADQALDYLSRTHQPVDEVDRRNFQQFIIAPLSALPRGDRNLMDIRFSPAQRGQLLDRIKESLIEEKPLSLVRLSEGEAYAYPPGAIEGFEPSVFEEDDRSKELEWWNARPSARVREDVMARVRQAVVRCDILACPSVYRIIRDLPPPGRRYGKNRVQRALMRLCGALGQSIPLDGKVFTEERCNRIKGALDPSFLFELAGLARSMVLVSRWPELSSRFPSGPKIEMVEVPREDADTKIFDVYPQIVKEVRAAVGPGSLVLVGAGVIGKILVDEARTAGAVAIDVGSLMDYMMGSKTRSITDLI